ncbi:MAG: hypothetical protein JXR41_02045 [Bacteroidales bacterium]|nr:hypothetical protein [Bacteroidales bacterium]MBN2761843.1 hypothetical protein [Bacteroidales bacterium]
MIILKMEGQFYSQGEDPASVQWEEIKTENFNLIYPVGFYHEANRFANLLEYYRPQSSYSLKNKPAGIPVVIHNRSVISNGFVSWAPRRVEIVALPEQNNYAQDWLEQLALHEYRHVVQVDKFRQGFTKVLSWLTGEIATGAASAYMPRWFLEGDAVVNETALSYTGRGRLPAFDMELRTVLLDQDRKYSYDQAFNGSYKYFIPDHYQYGYHMVSYARMRYGHDFWEKAINYAARNPYVMAPLSLYSLKHTGLNRAKLYMRSMDSVKILWNSKLSDVKLSNYSSILHKKTRLYQQYILPQPLSDKSIIALKTGPDLIDQIVCIDSSGNEEKLLEIGPSGKMNLSACDDYILWDEIVIDPRWARRSYSVIKSFNRLSGTEKQITHRTRYFSPDISNDGNKIIVYETDNENNNFLVLLHFPEGDVLKRMPSPGNKILQYPEWIDEKLVVVVTFDGNEKCIETVNVATGEWKIVYHAGKMDVSEPLKWHDYIIFRASYNGIDNIYACGRDSMLYQITSARFGAFHPAISHDKSHLLYSNYTSDGFEVAITVLDTFRWSDAKRDLILNTPWAEKLKQQELSGKGPEKSDFKLYEASSYNKYLKLFKFHSWLPFYINIDENNLSLDYQAVRPGFVLFSQNHLSTAFSTVSYRYDHGYHIIRPSFTYKGWYPVISLSAEIGGPVNIMPLPGDIDLPEIRPYRRTLKVKTYVPLLFSNGKYKSLIQPQLEYEWSNDLYYNEIYRSGLDFLHFRLYLYRYSRSALRDLYPKWGQFFSLTFTETPVDKGQFGKLLSAQFDFYFPGFMNHHSFRFNMGYQKQFHQHFYLPLNRLAFPRGYESTVAEEFMKASANYSFPFVYPDFSLSWFLYIKRMTANVFYDMSYGKNIQETADGERRPYTGIYNAAGLELFMDMHLLRIMFPFRAGLRYSYLPVRNSHDVELLFSVDTDIF